VRLSAERRLSVAWVVVVTITLIYLVIDGSVDDSDVMRASTVASVAAIGLALVKVRIVMRELMDVRHAPRILRTVTDALVLTMGVFLLGLRTTRPARGIVDELLTKGILAGTSGDPNVVRLLPPLVLEEAHVAKLAQALSEVKP